MILSRNCRRVPLVIINSDERRPSANAFALGPVIFKFEESLLFECLFARFIIPCYEAVGCDSHLPIFALRMRFSHKRPARHFHVRGPSYEAERGCPYCRLEL